MVSHTSKILMSSNEILIGFSWHTNLERGCPGATLRVWPWRERNKTPVELCGDQLDQYSEITSETNQMKVS